MKVRFLSNLDIALNLLNIIKKHQSGIKSANFDIPLYKKNGSACDMFVKNETSGGIDGRLLK